jgi:hypothetical protein
MSTFLNSLSEKLEAMEREIQSLPEELSAVMRRLDRGKLQSVLNRLKQDCDQLYEKQSAAQSSGVLPIPLILNLRTLSITPVTSEDKARWREAYRPKLWVVIGEGKVEVMAASEIAEKYKTTVSQIVPVAQQRGYTVLRWDQYIKLLDEIGKLLENEEQR